MVSLLYQFPLYPDYIPEELKLDSRWVVCDEEKVPYIALACGKKTASSTDPKTWRPLPTALAAFETGRYAGIGRVIAEDDPYVGIDLDDCRDPATGAIAPTALEIAERLDSYTEVSPSLTGIKIWVKASLKMAYVKTGLEVYPRGRYFTVTGQFLPRFPLTIEERTDELASIVSKEFPKPKKKPAYNGRPGKTIDLDDVLEGASVEAEAMVKDMSAVLKYRIRCPWVSEHTNEEASGTFVGQYESGALFFWCWHSHCRHRSWREFRHALAWRTTRVRLAPRGCTKAGISLEVAN